MKSKSTHRVEEGYSDALGGVSQQMGCFFRPLFVYFCSFPITISIIQIEKSIVGVLGIRTRGCRMVGADKWVVSSSPGANVTNKCLSSIAMLKQSTVIGCSHDYF